MFECSPAGWHCGRQLIASGGVKVKYPYSKKAKMLNEATETDKSLFLKVNNASFKLKENHIHNYQSQGFMNILGLPWWDFSSAVGVKGNLHVMTTCTKMSFIMIQICSHRHTNFV